MIGLLLVALLYPALAHAGLPLETESARFLKEGQLQFESTVEHQHSKEGTETDVPVEVEYGVTDWLQFLVEPVLYTNISPKGGPAANGVGDLELTLFVQLYNETPYVPALALAGEVKVPTASNLQIGTGETDYSPYLVASKRFNNLDLSANLGYDILGSPKGTTLHNIIFYAASAEYTLDEKWQLVAEILGNTSSSPTTKGGTPAEQPDALRASAVSPLQAGGIGPVPVVPEATGNELSGLIGVRYFVKRNLYFSFGVSYDNKNAVLVRPGISYVFDLF